MKGDTNPLTKVLEKAQQIVEDRERRMLADYGIPLFVTEGGRNELLEWPADPEKVSPEEMQILIDTRGDAAVGRWLAEHYQAQQEPE
jgi:hypothetical protein